MGCWDVRVVPLGQIFNASGVGYSYLLHLPISILSQVLPHYHNILSKLELLLFGVDRMSKEAYNYTLIKSNKKIYTLYSQITAVKKEVKRCTSLQAT